MQRVRRGEDATVGQGIDKFLTAGETSGVFQRSPPGTVDQAGQRTVVVRGPAGNELEPMKPAVTEVILVERFPEPRASS